MKSLSVGIRKRDALRESIHSPDNLKLQQLNDFADILDKWKAAGFSGLSAETNWAASLTCRSICLVSEYLINKCGFQYVLLGQIQSDPLESRFGRYRGMSGSNFYISHKQLVQGESKIKITMLLEHSGLPVSEIHSLEFDSEAFVPTLEGVRLLFSESIDAGAHTTVKK